jgi:hypothetical protein
VDSKAIRSIAVIGILSVFIMTLMMMFSLDQMADTQAPQIALDLAKDLQRSLAEGPPPPVRLTMIREGKGALAPRLYTLRLRPTAAVQGDAHALERLMYRASELCAAQLGDVKAEVRIRCVAELAGGAEREATYVKDRADDTRYLSMIHRLDVPAAAPAASAPTPAVATPAGPKPR